MQYVEDILESNLIQYLQYIYNKDNEDQTMLIFFLRCYIYFGSEKISNEQYILFLIKELNLPNDIIYRDIKISQRKFDDNSLQNIMDCFIYRYLDTHYDDPIRGRVSGNELIHIYYKRYLEGTERLLKNKKNKIQYYEHIKKYNMLLQLYSDFNLSIQPIKRFKHFKYTDYHNDFELSFDEECQRYYNEYRQTQEKILEKDLEEYICKNNFEDIKIINRQLKIKSGIIDLLGMDSNGTKIVIELKVTSRPKDLIWQLQAYTNDLKNVYKELRTIAITPPLDINILKQIPKEFEVYEFIKTKTGYKFKKVQ